MDEKKYINNIFFIKNSLLEINLGLLGGSNNLPVFSSNPTLISTEDTNYVYNITITDIDSNDTVVISAPVLPSWLTLVDNGNKTAVLSGTPVHENVGNNVVKLRATDSSGGVTDQDFTINILNNPNFENLQLISSDSISSSLGYIVSMDDSNVTISLVNNNYSWLTFENNVLTGVLPDDLTDNIEFQIKVQDNDNGNSRTYTYQLDISENARPVLQDLQLVLDSSLTKNYIAPYFETDSDNVTFSIELSDPSITWITIDSSTGVISGTPPDDYHNSTGSPIIITVSANDGKLIVQKQFTLVVEKNDLTNVDDLQLISYSPSENKYIVPYFDIDTTVLEILEGPSWVTLSNNGGNYSLTTNDNYTDNIHGDFDLSIKFTDIRFGEVIKNMTIRIQQEPIVKETAITALTVDEESSDQEIELTDIFGPDGLSFTYGAISSDSSKISTSIDGSKLTLSFLQNAFGNVVITTSASDGLNTTNHDITVTIVNVEDEATGTLTFTGTVAEGEIVTADISNIFDEDGILTFSYQWQISDDDVTFNNISNAINNSFTIPDDQSYVDKYIRLTAVSTDSNGGTTDFTSASEQVANVESEATGTLSFDGDCEEGGTITANISNITDVDDTNGLLTFSYQWQLSDTTSFDSNSNITDATDASFTIPSDQSYVDKYIRLTAVSTDSRGGTTEFQSESQQVANVEDEAIGTLSFDGDCEEGGTLTANISDITDVDNTSQSVSQNNSTQTTESSVVNNLTQITRISFGTGTGSGGPYPKYGYILWTDNKCNTYDTGTEYNFTFLYMTSNFSYINPTNSSTVSSSEQETLSNMNSRITSAGKQPEIGTKTYYCNKSYTIPLSMDDLSEILDVIFYNLISNFGTYNSTSLSQPLQWQTIVNYIKNAYLQKSQNLFSYLDQTSPTTNIIDLLTSEQFSLWKGYDNSPNCNDKYSSRCYRELTTSNLNTFSDMMLELSNESFVHFTVVKSILYYMSQFRSYSPIVDAYNNMTLQPSGTLTFTGTVKNGATLTAVTSNIFDGNDSNNPLTFTFQWQLSDTDNFDNNSNISGATSSTFTIPSDESYVNKYLRLTVEAEDIGGGTKSFVTSSQQVAIVENGFIFTYQWQLSSTTSFDINSNIAGATQDSFTIPSDQSYVNKYIRLTAISTDSRGGTTEFQSAYQQVVNVEDEATGTLLIDGTVEEGATLTADTSNISDVDGDLTFTYQWQLSSTTSFDSNSNIADAIQASFTIPSDQSYVDKYIRLTAVSTDSLGGTTEFQSASQQIANVEDEATGTLIFTGTVQEGATLTADTSGISDVDGSLTFTFQWQLADDSSSFDTNSNISGATNSTFTIPSDQSYVDKFIRLTAVSTDSRGGNTSFETSSQQVLNVEDEATGTLVFTGTVQEGATLTAVTSNISDVDDTNNLLTFTFQWQVADDSSSFDTNSNISGATNSTFTIPSDQSYVDKFIRLTAVSIDSRGGTTSFETSSQQILNVEDEATGTLSFTGTVQEGATLTADISNISDVDDTNVQLTFTFQWQLSDDSSNFDTNSNISGATNSTFTIPSDQSYVDKFIRLTAVSTDSRGGTTSFETSSQQVLNVEDEATGTLIFTGTVQEGATLTADTSNISDVDDTNVQLTFTFQWQLADDSSSFDTNSNIIGATNSTFTIPSDQSYVDKFIRLTAVSTDSRGGTTSFETSSQQILNVEDEATGTLIFTGTVQEGATLTADTSDISDVDGSLTFTFQWQLADDSSSFDTNSNINGATNSTFTIPSDQSYVDKFIRLTAVSTDARGGITSFETSSQQVLNVEDEATGTLIFTGTVQEGATLTADTSDISDVDGSLTFTFQWQLADDSSSFDTNSNINGATNSTFTIPSDQSYVDKFIRLTAVSTDSRGGTTFLKLHLNKYLM